MDNHPFVEENTILRVEVGSTVHGLGIGTDDRDEMGITIEPPDFVMGLRQFEQLVQRDQPEGVRSQPGDLDLTIYSARKWCKLALKGNPTALLPLFVPTEKCIVLTEEGAQLRDIYDAFASKRGGRACLGYVNDHRQRLMGERGMKVNRPELVEAHGYDTKYAGHLLRLAFQGVEYMRDGRFSVPMPDHQRDFIVAIRKGEVSFDDFMTYSGHVESDLRHAVETTKLPDVPDYEEVNKWLVRSYLATWPNTRSLIYQKTY